MNDMKKVNVASNELNNQQERHKQITVCILPAHFIKSYINRSVRIFLCINPCINLIHRNNHEH